jgi:hypothetical protein
MSEKLETKNEYALSPEEILEGLANNMRAYDKLVEQREPLTQAQEAANQGLELLNIEVPASLQPEGMALKALEFIISDRKLAVVQKEISNLEDQFMGSIFLYLGGLKGKKTEVTAINPEKERLGAFTGTGNVLTYAGRSYDSRKGKLVNLNLDPDIGGFIEIRGSTFLYQAGPLIDRENDYSPLFEIKLLDK